MPKRVGMERIDLGDDKIIDDGRDPFLSTITGSHVDIFGCLEQGMVALVLLAPASPSWAIGLLTFCGYDAARGQIRAETFLVLMAQSYLMAGIVALLYWPDLLRWFSQRIVNRWALAATFLAPLLGVYVALQDGRLVFAGSARDDAILRGPATAPNFDLVDQHGWQVTLDSLKGKVVLVTFFYANCYESCPVLMHNVQAVLDRFPYDGTGRHLLGVAITVDPSHDRPGMLASVADRWHLDHKRFLLLTGDISQVNQALDGFGIFRQTLADGRIIHSNLILLLDQKGRKAYALDGVGGDLKGLIEATSALLARSF